MRKTTSEVQDEQTGAHLCNLLVLYIEAGLFHLIRSTLHHLTSF